MKTLHPSRKLVAPTPDKTGPTVNILVIEDNEDDYFLLLRECSRANLPIEAKRVDTNEALRHWLFSQKWDVVISDHNIPGGRVNIKSSLALVRDAHPTVPFIVISGTLSDHEAVDYLHLGVNDYVFKDNLIRVVPVIKRILEERKNQSQKIEAESRLVESNERFRMLAESIKDMFFAMDKTFNCTYWNAVAEKMTRIKASDALGKNVYQLFPQFRGTAIEEKFLQGISTLRPITAELCVDHDLASWFYQISIYPSADIYSVLVKDITHTKLIETKLKETNEELETFMYRISHDIRGPIASLMGLMNLARNNHLSSTPIDILAQTEKMTHRLDNIVRALSANTRIKQERVHWELLNLATLVGQVKEKLVKNGKMFTLLYKGDPGLELFTDAKLMEIILEKILQNAVDYSSPVRDPKVAIYVEQKNAYTTLTLHDNAVGIPTPIIGKIFNMFYRGNEGSKGSGLGLYLVKNAVEKLKGNITVKSTMGEGTAFTVNLPHPFTEEHYV